MPARADRSDRQHSPAGRPPGHPHPRDGFGHPAQRARLAEGGGQDHDTTLPQVRPLPGEYYRALQVRVIYLIFKNHFPLGSL